MEKVVFQDGQDLVDIFNDINHALILKMNQTPAPHQPLVNEAHDQKVAALRIWLTTHKGKVLAA